MSQYRQNANRSVTKLQAPRHKFDPLDREILERAFSAAGATLKETKPLVIGFENDDDSTTTLRCRLSKIAQTNRFDDAEALRDLLLDYLTSDRAGAC